MDNITLPHTHLYTRHRHTVHTTAGTSITFDSFTHHTCTHTTPHAHLHLDYTPHLRYCHLRAPTPADLDFVVVRGPITVLHYAHHTHTAHLCTYVYHCLSLHCCHHYTPFTNFLVLPGRLPLKFTLRFPPVGRSCVYNSLPRWIPLLRLILLRDSGLPVVEYILPVRDPFYGDGDITGVQAVLLH